jgi:hypothetical protein
LFRRDLANCRLGVSSPSLSDQPQQLFDTAATAGEFPFSPIRVMTDYGTKGREPVSFAGPIFLFRSIS